jgi:iron complex outermembrane receptor protein
MNSVSCRASRRTFVLHSVALSSVFWPLDAWSQGAPQTSRTLDPVVVTNPIPTLSPRQSNSTPAARSTRGGKKRAAAVAAATPSAVVPGSPAAPTLTLNQTAGSGSRLNLTRLQTPASVEIINAETIAERGQHSVIDAVTQNATGFTASPAPGNGGLSFNTRGFTGNSTVMTLYDGTRLYVGSGTLTFPFDTWSAQRIEVLRGPASAARSM